MFHDTSSFHSNCAPIIISVDNQPNSSTIFLTLSSFLTCVLKSAICFGKVLPRPHPFVPLTNRAARCPTILCRMSTIPGSCTATLSSSTPPRLNVNPASLSELSATSGLKDFHSFILLIRNRFRPWDVTNGVPLARDRPRIIRR